LNTALGGLAILGLFAAAIAQPTIGMLSDRTCSRWGARYPYFVAGSVGTLVSLLILVNAADWVILLPIVVLVQVSVNAVQSPLQALIPDFVQPGRMGIASGIKTVLELSGVIASGLVVWAFLGTHTRPEVAVMTVSLCLFLAIWITIRAAPARLSRPAPEKRLDASGRYLRRYGGGIRQHIRLGWQSLRQVVRRRHLGWWLASRFFFYASFNTIGRFAITYLQDVFGYSGEEARELQGIVLLITGVLIFGATLLSGILADQMGRKRLAAFGAVISTLAALLLVISPNLIVAIFLMTFVGIGSGIYFSAGWALATHLVPVRQAAFYLGFMNLATTLGGAFGMLGGYLVDRINDAAADPMMGYGALFVLTGICFGLGAFTIQRIHDPEKLT
jgi:MFS family permease